MSLPMKARHYQKIPQLALRTRGDVPREALDVQILGRTIMGEFIEPKPENPRLVSTAHGALSELLFAIPAYAVHPPNPGGANPIAEAYRDLFSQLPRSTRLVIMTHASVASTVRDWVREFSNPIVVSAPDHIHFSIWAEDGYVVIKDAASGERFFLEPYEFPRYGDALIADFVSHRTHMKDTQAPLYFQGGNVLVGDDFFFIGADYAAKTLKYFEKGILISSAGERPADTVRRLYTEYMDHTRRLEYVGSSIPVPQEAKRTFSLGGETWTEYLHLGNGQGTVQPLFHIDMFVTLAGLDGQGRYQLVVGDPRLAAETLGSPLLPHAMADVFDNIAQNLAKRGYVVIRSPLPLVYEDDPAERSRYWYFATANNALVEITSDAKAVWLPSYGHGNWQSLEATDRANRQIWESLGFTVNMLGDFHPFAANLGAVHCIKKYLERGAACFQPGPDSLGTPSDARPGGEPTGRR